MSSRDSQTRVPYAAADMFALVADVERYPEFVPLCEALRVKDRRRNDNQEIVLADMTVGYKAIRETFTSQVHLKPEELSIQARYIDGPFRSLDNRWAFSPAKEGECDVKFFIAYEFKSRMLAALMGAMFDRAFRKFSDAFEARANAVYGPG